MKHIPSPWCECSRCFTDSCAPPPRKAVVAAAHAAITRTEAEPKGPHVLVHKQLLAQLTTRTEAEQAVLDAMALVPEEQLYWRAVAPQAELDDACKLELVRRKKAAK